MNEEHRKRISISLKGRKKPTFSDEHKRRLSEYPELRFSIDNGRTLCVPCHKEKTKQEKQ